MSSGTDSHVDENEIVELIQGALTDSRQERLEAHLDHCPDCRELLAAVSRSEAVEKEPSSSDTLIPWHEAEIDATARTEIRDEGIFKPDTLVDNFQIIRFVNRGGMGEIYLARDIGLGRRVALKVIRWSRLRSRRTRERFLFEARATARFNHPHIVAIHSVGEFRGLPYVALEYLEGESLRNRINRGRLGPKEAIRIARAIASALEEAHQHGIIHRDLKPENVLIPKDGRPRVVDFGLATAFHDESLENRPSSHPTVIDPGARHEIEGGTPIYMSPEQWTKQDADGATDVWALGVIIYEMLAGRRPYQAFEESRAELARNVLVGEPMPPLPAAAMPPLAELVARCLKRDAKDRPSAREIVEKLAELTELRTTPLARNPFRGLLPFSERHADLFFGRDAEVAAAVERIRDETIIAIIGASGAGKSSFVQAGIVPRLREQGVWSVIKLRPGSDPFYTLAGRILGGEETAELPEDAFNDAHPTRPPLGPGERIMQTLKNETFSLSRELFESPDALALHLNRVAGDRGGRVLLLVDQLEELSTLVKSERVRIGFMRAVLAAGEDREGPIRVILTVRDDFLGRIAVDCEGHDAFNRVLVLKSPGPAALHDVVQKPVLALGYRFEVPEIVDGMVEAVAGEPAALPLLSFAANLWWERRDEPNRLLTSSAYGSMGGVAGALADHADGVLLGLSADRVRVAKQILLRLVSSDRTHQVITREQALDRLGPEAGEVLKRLIQSRLVTVRRAILEAEDETHLELVHESLIQTWQQLERWLDESKEEDAALEPVGTAAPQDEQTGRETELELRRLRRLIRAGAIGLVALAASALLLLLLRG